MKTFPASRVAKGFSLLELLIVVALIAILAAMLLPALSKAPSYMTRCMLKQRFILNAEFHWQADHDGQILWQVSATGLSASGNIVTNVASMHFRSLSNYIWSPADFVCSADPGRKVSTTKDGLADVNLSYFVNLSAVTNRTDSVVTGDRHLQINERPTGSRVVSLATNELIEWTKELHGKSRGGGGVLGFADGHVERVKSESLNKVFQRQNFATNLLAIP